jgi:omega-6 fatty acid desaturase (delta-12 desaturase)
VARFRGADNERALIELAVTAIPFIALWLAAILLVRAGIWTGLALALPAGAFLLRLFLIQHDCGHGSFFSRRTANSWVGRAIGVLTLTPYEFWRRSHAWHHAGTGNLDRRGLGDIDTLTVAEFGALSRWSQLGYRLYRHPAVLFGLGPAYQFLICHRIPAGQARRSWSAWGSAMGTNLAIFLLGGALMWLFGMRAFLLVQLPVTLVAASIGMWLFYVQHQFDGTTWDRNGDWNFQQAALHGSSWYDLPSVLRWFSANIGIHHVHHLCSTIPFYRLPAVLRACPELRTAGRLTLRDSLRTTRLALWDEEARRMLSFREAYRTVPVPRLSPGAGRFGIARPTKVAPAGL